MPHSKKHVLTDYWKRGDILSIPVFAEYFTRDRYKFILSFLHFANNEEDEADPLWKIRPVLTNLVQKSRRFFKPFQKLVIHESLMFKGRVKFKQYIPSKCHKFGLKLFILCDCHIVLDVTIYSASDADIHKKDPLVFFFFQMLLSST